MPSYLLVAHQTADSEELVEAVAEIAGREAGAEFTLLVPATPVEHLATWTEGENQAVAREAADRARKSLEAAGATVTDTIVGDASPFTAIQDALLVGSYDALVVSTLPLKASRWLRMDLIHRLERAVSMPIIHVIADSRS